MVTYAAGERGDGMSTDSQDSILEMDAKVSNIMKDIRSRLNSLYDKYLTDDRKLPKLPSYDSMIKDTRVRYNASKTLTELIDELIQMKLRVSLVSKQISSMRNIQITSKGNYTLISNFKNNLKSYDEELSEARYELSDLIKNANNKVRILDSVSFYAF